MPELYIDHMGRLDPISRLVVKKVALSRAAFMHVVALSYDKGL